MQISFSISSLPFSFQEENAVEEKRERFGKTGDDFLWNDCTSIQIHVEIRTEYFGLKILT